VPSYGATSQTSDVGNIHFDEDDDELHECESAILESGIERRRSSQGSRKSTQS